MERATPLPDARELTGAAAADAVAQAFQRRVIGGDVWTTTASGRQIFLLAPRAEDILVEDIAHHLAHVARWGGATREFYSVAQHSVHVATLVEPAHRLWALLHDGSEYLLGDVVKYFKHWSGMTHYRTVEAQLQTLIFQRFGLSGEMPADVHECDELVAITEAQDLFTQVPAHFPPAFHDRSKRLPKTIEPWAPTRARANFLEAFARLTKVNGHASLKESR